MLYANLLSLEIKLSNMVVIATKFSENDQYTRPIYPIIIIHQIQINVQITIYPVIYVIRSFFLHVGRSRYVRYA